MDNFEIRSINLEHMDFLIDLAKNEGWNPGLHDHRSFYQADTEGFFIGYLNNKPINCISAVNYNNEYGFLGLYITIKDFRHKGYGIKLWNHAMNYLADCNVGLDGVVDQQENYAKQGFKFAHKNVRYLLRLDKTYNKHPQATEITDSFTEKLYHFDSEIFNVARHSFLKNWITDPEAKTFLKMNYDEVSGYVTIRKCYDGYKIGPLFSSSFHDADQLMQSALSVIEKNSNVYLDIPETNPAAVELVQRYNMVPVFETARMYNKFIPNIPISKVFGITSFELG